MAPNLVLYQAQIDRPRSGFGAVGGANCGHGLRDVVLTAAGALLVDKLLASVAGEPHEQHRAPVQLWCGKVPGDKA